MAKKVVKKLAKKNYGGVDSTPANTIKAKQINMDVAQNPNYRKTSNTDPTGENIYIRKTGYEGPSKAVKGVAAPSGTYASDAVSKKAVVPTMTPRPLIKKGGAIMAKKKMGGTTKAKKK